jgi:23S rRNA (uracil1939-C5)-methyltransferase
MEKAVVLEKPVYGGDCLAHLAANGETDARSGKSLFVPLTLPGETVTARLIEEKRTYAKAELDQVLIPSLNRVAPRCPYFGACGGCHYQHANYPTQLALKRQILRETIQRAGVQLPFEIVVLAGEHWGYRNRIRLALTPEGGLGYRSRRSHDLIPIRTCPIAAQLLLETAERAARFLSVHPGGQTVSELELFTNHNESQLLLTLFTASAGMQDEFATKSWLAALHAALPSQTTGIRLQLADSIFEGQAFAATGQPSLTYTAANFPYRVDHGAFFQVNRWLVDEFVAAVVGNARGGVAWDLYAGVGLFARQLTATFAQVLAAESAPASLAALQNNLAGADARAIAATTLDFLRRNREQREARPDFIVLDPPRTGLGDHVTHLLNAIHAPEMIYVSCDPATLARDLRQLTQERYRIEAVTLTDMFPQTFHIETVVRLRRI